MEDCTLDELKAAGGEREADTDSDGEALTLRAKQTINNKDNNIMGKNENRPQPERPKTGKGRLAEWMEMAKNEPKLIIYDMRAVLK